MLINLEKIEQSSCAWNDAVPFPHMVVDDFFEPDLSKRLAAEFPDFESDVWHEYNNAIEVKKLAIIGITSPKQPTRFLNI